MCVCVCLRYATLFETAKNGKTLRNVSISSSQFAWHLALAVDRKFVLFAFGFDLAVAVAVAVLLLLLLL